ncbi:MAG: hypothetical protein DBX47_01135 [Clostridiales bacterium]|nr:MAG: hypothetical protein DBX47_01135 [Clostridiales bacterium]
MEHKGIINPRKAIFWMLIYSIAAPIIGFGFIWLQMIDVYLYIPRMLYSFTFLPVLLLSTENASILWIIILVALPIIAYFCCIINCFLSIKKNKTFFIIPTIVFLSIDLLLTSFVMIGGYPGAIFSFILDAVYIVLLYYLRTDINKKNK